MAGHAGTVPMALRRDALAGAAECIVAVEAFCRDDGAGLVGTVGVVNAMPGATNVISGRVSFTLDIRAPADAHRKLAVAEIVRRIEAIAKRRDLSLQIDVTHENRTVPARRGKRRWRKQLPPKNYPVRTAERGRARRRSDDRYIRCRHAVRSLPRRHRHNPPNMSNPPTPTPAPGAAAADRELRPSARSVGASYWR
jgi:metal-dependent amidase/aminoacylase/carboxypeptidase family protein